ncbi:MAG: aldo/keto reductase, partial [Bryobacteraceae bacterium]
PWSPLAGGLLSGKFTREGTSDPNARRAGKFDFPPMDLEKTHKIVDVMRVIAKNKQATVAQIALAWLLAQPFMTSLIIGARNETQLKDNLGSVNVKLDSAELEQLDAVSRLAPEYPGWMQAMQTSRRLGHIQELSRAATQKS